MRTFGLILSGFVLTLAIFSGGVISAVALLNVDPVPVRKLDMDASGLWTAKAVTVDTTSQDFERFSDEPLIASVDEEALIDTTTTASLPDDMVQPKKDEPADPAMNVAHLEWCRDRYRSYRPETNSYTPFSGGQRDCVSPFSDNPSGIEGAVIYAEETVEGELFGYAVGTDRVDSHISSEHIQSCFARYRSYRAEDNTYQPYGGGPRRQCR